VSFVEGENHRELGWAPSERLARDSGGGAPGTRVTASSLPLTEAVEAVAGLRLAAEGSEGV
jgi:hypothetical protein